MRLPSLRPAIHRVILWLLAVIVGGLAFPAVALEVGGLGIERSGVFTAGGLRFSVSHFGPGWAFANQGNQFAPAPGFPQDSAQVWEGEGRFQPATAGAAPLALQQRLQRRPDGKGVDAQWQVTHAPGLPTAGLFVSVAIPVAAGADRLLEYETAAGRQSLRLAPAFDGQPTALSNPVVVNRLVLPTSAGRLEIEGRNLRVSLQDNRSFGAPEFGLRIFFEPGAGTITSAGLALSIVRFDAPAAVAASPVIEAGPEWAAYEHVLDIEPGSVFDRSALADAPAGAHGRVVASPQGQLVFETQPGAPLRFWGVNLTFDTQFMTHAQSDRLAERLRRAGYNTVRLHHYEPDLLVRRGRVGEIDLDQLDRLDYLFAALKRCGIYVMTGAYATRFFAPEDGSPASQVRRGEHRWLIPVSDPAFEAWSRFARQLLTHRNPYTGTSWADDPALLSVYLLNEETLLAGGYAGMSAETRALYEQRYGQWRARQPEVIPDTGPDAAAAFNRFLVETQQAGNDRMMDFLRGLGVKALLTTDNAMNTEAQVFVRARLDAVDNHEYWNHPVFLGGPWSLPAQGNHDSLVSGGLWLPRKLMASRIFGKPYIVSEFNDVWPNAARAEIGLLMAGYAGLQGWDALYYFDYASSAAMLLKPSVQAGAGVFDMVVDPVGMLTDRAAAFLFRYGGILTAPHAVAYLADPRTAFAGARGRAAELPPEPSWMGLLTRVGSLPADAPDLAATAQRQGVLAFASRRADAAQVAGRPNVTSDINLDKRLAALGAVPARTDPAVFRSETGQIEISRQRGTARLVTPYSESFVLPAGVQLQGERVTASADQGRSVIYAMAVDGRPLAESGRLLVLHLTDSLNTGTRFSDASRTKLLAVGKLPHLVRHGAATISLKLAEAGAEGWQAWAVDAAGRRLAPAKFSRQGDAWVLQAQTAPDDKKVGAVLAYELLRR